MVKTRASNGLWEDLAEGDIVLDQIDADVNEPKASSHHSTPVANENNSNRCNSAAGSAADTSVLSVESKGNCSDDSDFDPDKKPKTKQPGMAYRQKLEEERDEDYDDMSSTQNNVRRSSRPKKPTLKDTEPHHHQYSTRRHGMQSSQSSRSQNTKRIHSSSDSEMTRGYGRRSSKRRPVPNRRNGIGSPEEGEEEEDGDMYSRIKNTRRSTRTCRLTQLNHEEVSDISESDSDVAKPDDELGQTLLGTIDGETPNQGSGGRVLRRKRVIHREPPDSDDYSLKKGYALRNRPSFSVIEQIQKSPLGMKRPKRRHQRKRFAHNSSSSSSSSDESSFERKKAGKMAKARSQCLPLNMKPADLLKGTLRDRIKVGSSLADIEPMTMDTSITFESIGGLTHHINSLKEMVLFPLLYPEVFEKFKVQSPRGVLFFGPPGTGKTLVARALANECSTEGKKVAFFMRKGADCMSKWVGESERQLRLLFDQAYSMRPSIIFFDEIDGIAPVRSTRQDQIHSSIVSTLLALMDGLDSRGEVIVIGATNRIEAIDPALRRPGRFDREFYFPLPSFEARRKILNIHTKDWSPAPGVGLVETLAARTVGYCGADLKALCSEAVLLALRRRYQQIYTSKNKLKLDLDAVSVTFKEFNTAINKKIVPAAQRSVAAAGSPLPLIMKSLLAQDVSEAVEQVKSIFPNGFQRQKVVECRNTDSDDDVDESLLTDQPVLNLRDGNGSLRYAGIFRPRLVICGTDDFGQDYVARALVNEMEQVNCFKLDSSRNLEELSIWFSEMMKRLPLASVLYAPLIEDLDDNLFTLLVTLLNASDATVPLLFMATSRTDLQSFDEEVKKLFEPSKTTLKTVFLERPSLDARKSFFSPLLKKFIRKPISRRSEVKLEKLEEVAIESIEPRKLSDKELKKLRRKEDAALRELRLFLRDILGKIVRDRRFSIFLKPVDVEEVPDYHTVIKMPMDLETMMVKIDYHVYETAKDFLVDIELICCNALEYNPNRDSNDKQIRHRACALRDFANAVLDAEMNSDFENYCQEIHTNRQKRNESPTKSVPSMLRPPLPVDAPVMADKKDEDTEIESATEHSVANSSNNSVTDPSSQSIFVCSPTIRKVTRKKTKKRTKQGPPADITVEDVQPDLPETPSVPSTSSAITFPSTSSTITFPSNNVCEQVIPVEKIVIVNDDKLNGIFEKLMHRTEGFNVSQLEKLYWSLFRLIRNRQNDLDKSLLLEEIEAEIDDSRIPGTKSQDDLK